MSTVTLRFVGRFVYAEPLDDANKPLGYLDVLAINMGFNPDVPASKHRFCLTAPRGALARRGVLTPDLMIVSREKADEAEYGVWFLDGHDVVLDGRRTFKWAPPKEGQDFDLPKLKDLSGGLEFDPTSVVGGPVTARIHVPLGVGSKHQIVPGKGVTFVPLGNQEPTAAEQDQLKKFSMKVADMVEVAVDVSDDVRRLSLKVGRRMGGPLSSIVVKTRPDENIKVTFSNLCPLPHVQVDEEFAALYEVLRRPPLAAERLVPKEMARAGHIDDCYNQGFIDYRV